MCISLTASLLAWSTSTTLSYFPAYTRVWTFLSPLLNSHDTLAGGAEAPRTILDNAHLKNNAVLLQQTGTLKQPTQMLTLCMHWFSFQAFSVVYISWYDMHFYFQYLFFNVILAS